MAESPRPILRASPEQRSYAAILEKGMLLGLLLLLLTYLVYVTGLLKPYVPLSMLPEYWGHEVGHYLHEAQVPIGWSWVTLLRYGDFLNFLGIATLAGTSIICYARILPRLWRGGDRVYALLAVLQILVLCLAASGFLGSSGGH
ncbi:MAG: DUF1634 domain-containing protein [Candidatus Krumholzibacteriia bacterium]